MDKIPVLKWYAFAVDLKDSTDTGSYYRLRKHIRRMSFLPNDSWKNIDRRRGEQKLMTNYTLNIRQGYTSTIASIVATLGAHDGTWFWQFTNFRTLLTLIHCHNNYLLCVPVLGELAFLIINFNKFDCGFSKLR